MKTRICWFSGTGNSLWVARTLAEALGDTEVVPIARTDPTTLAPVDRLGLVFPVYAWGPPRIVARFIEKCGAEQSNYVFAVVTCGGNAGSTGPITRKMLRRQGADLDAAFSIPMVENYPRLGGAPGEAKQKKALAEAEERIEEVIAALKTMPHGDVRTGGFPFAQLGPLVYRFFVPNLPRMDRRFSADEQCNGCRVCEMVCPVGNIAMSEGKPTWLGNCEQCFACFHFCPQKAVQYGGNTAKQIRYHHPACKVSDFYAG